MRDLFLQFDFCLLNSNRVLVSFFSARIGFECIGRRYFSFLLFAFGALQYTIETSSAKIFLHRFHFVSFSFPFLSDHRRSIFFVSVSIQFIRFVANFSYHFKVHYRKRRAFLADGFGCSFNFYQAVVSKMEIN